MDVEQAPPAHAGLSVDTTLIFDPKTNSVSPGPKLPATRRSHAAVLLGDGKVLLFGGQIGATNTTTNTSVLVDVSAGTATHTSTVMSTTRYQVGGVVLNDGRVFVSGGYNGSYLNKTDIFQ